MLVEHLQRISPGSVGAFICEHVPAAVTALERARESRPKDMNAVLLRWRNLPPVENLIQETLLAMAEVAFAFWPSWYSQHVSFSTDGGPVDQEIQNSTAISQLIRTRHDISVPWLRAAAKHCRAGRIPLLDGFPHEIQAAQLAMVIHPEDLLVSFAVEDIDPPEDRLFGLAKTAEWFARRTNSRIAVLIPKHVAGSPFLDSILYGAETLTLPQQPEEAYDRCEKLNHIVWPINGKPHPFSPGEQKLAKLLALDKDLKDLFTFNQGVETTRGSRYTVDLLWRDGKVVVEVDGYQHHSNRFAFSLDRHRDYELTISGFTVLRLPHDEVMEDAERSIEKIRDMVAFRRRNFNKDSEETA
ncbi:MAG: DUF559 domain-containing protein [Pseudomonadota bacterium]